MERVVRYPNAYRALEAGTFLSNTYLPEFLIGLNFALEPEGTVVMGAYFEGSLVNENPVLLNIFLLPGEVVKGSFSELILDPVPGTIFFLGDGLPLYEWYCQEKLGIKMGE